MTPDYDAAATKATETLIRHKISCAPVDPLPILKTTPGVLALTFAEVAISVGEDRQRVLSSFAADNRDVVTTVCHHEGRLVYIVAYNQRLPFYMLQRGLARELGHIILHHDGSRPESVRAEEALVFARHLICPRPLIKALQEALSPLTMETVGNVTGCYERCLLGIKKTPGAHVPPELNRLVREQFAEYVRNFLDCHSILTSGDITGPAEFGSYMGNYEE